MPENRQILIDQLNESFASATLPDRLRLLRKAVSGRIVFTTSFGIEDQAVTHAIFDSKVDFEVVTLDTGRLFPETYDVWQRTEEKYVLRIKAYYPQAAALEALIADQGINGFYYGLDMRKACCEVRKVEPLARALAGARVWVTGLRGDQNAHRSNLHFVEWDEERGLIKANPVLDYTRDDVVIYARAHDAPVNALHDKGFISIGCAPCTRAVKPGELERAGRWWWESEDKKECGLHVSADGRVSRLNEAAPKEAAQ
jgi:phosphoadenosine phosphosulfate reductase